MRPFIRLRDNIEFWRGGRIPNTPKLYLKPKEAKALVGYLIQPVKRRAVLLRETRGNPNDSNASSPDA